MSEQFSISVKNLSKSFLVHKKQEGLKGSLKALFVRDSKYVNAVENVSFDIKQGELVGFIGPNGAGKTTTLKMLSGILYPTEGSVEVLGYKPFDRKHDFLKKISLVMGQKNQLAWDLPPIETFNLNKEIYEIPTVQFKNVLDELVAMLGIEEILHVQVRKLSLGQRMKCELAAAILHSPKVLFLDEPTIGLDVVAQKKLRVFIKEYNRKYNATIILTSHYMGDVQELCERIMIIGDGKLGYDGNLTDLVRSYAKTKTITLVMLRPIDLQLAESYGHIKEFDPLRVVYEVNREDIKQSASRMLNDLPVDDLDISEMPIEEIIREVFGSAA